MAIENLLLDQIREQRWFAGKNQSVVSVQTVDSVPFYPVNGTGVVGSPAVSPVEELQIIAVTDDAGRTANYVLMVELRNDHSGDEPLRQECSQQAAAWRRLLVALLTAPAELVSRNGRKLRLNRTAAGCMLSADLATVAPLHVQAADQSNSSALLGDEVFIKLFRRVEAGPNPDAELSRQLTEHAGFRDTPEVLATIELVSELTADNSDHACDYCLGILSRRVDAQGDAWQYTLGEIHHFWQRIVAAEKCEPQPPNIIWCQGHEWSTLPDVCLQTVASFLDDVERLGCQTAEMHSALASDSANSDFAPEPLTARRFNGLVSAIRNEIAATCSAVGRLGIRADGMPDAASLVATRAHEMLDRTMTLIDAAIESRASGLSVIRCHGDYHLGQILRVADGFMIIDFEGEPDRSLAERREKRCVFKDVAGMVRSLHYASCASLLDSATPCPIQDGAAWNRFWYNCCVVGFLNGYMATAAGKCFVPTDSRMSAALLDLFLLEKVLYELRYEVNNRPAWISVPLAGLSDVLGINLQLPSPIAS